MINVIGEIYKYGIIAIGCVQKCKEAEFDDKIT